MREVADRDSAHPVAPAQLQSGHIQNYQGNHRSLAGEHKGVAAKHGGHTVLHLYQAAGEGVSDRGLVHPAEQAQHHSGHKHAHRGEYSPSAGEHKGAANKHGGHAVLNSYQVTGEEVADRGSAHPASHAQFHSGHNHIHHGHHSHHAEGHNGAVARHGGVAALNPRQATDDGVASRSPVPFAALALPFQVLPQPFVPSKLSAVA